MPSFTHFSPTLWPAYELLDFGKGQRLERWGSRVLIRPDVEAFGKPGLPLEDWKQSEFRFEERRGKPGCWRNEAGVEVEEQWPVPLEIAGVPHPLSVELRLTPFKHLGVFPEQYSQWQWLAQVIKDSRGRRREPPRVLNLFAYTGVASLVAASAGASVTHIEASKSTIRWGRENQERSGLLEAPIRWIPEDAVTFVERELARGNRYDAILLDPPAYGVGPGGKRWQFDRGIWPLLEHCRALLSDDPLFLLLNAYASALSARRWSIQMAELMGPHGGEVSVDSLGIACAARKQPLTTGLSVLWEKGSHSRSLPFFA